MLIRHRLHFSEEKTVDIFSEDIAPCPAGNGREIISQRKTNAVQYYSHVESKKAKIVGIQPRMVVTRGERVGL